MSLHSPHVADGDRPRAPIVPITVATVCGVLVALVVVGALATGSVAAQEGDGGVERTTATHVEVTSSDGDLSDPPPEVNVTIVDPDLGDETATVNFSASDRDEGGQFAIDELYQSLGGVDDVSLTDAEIEVAVGDERIDGTVALHSLEFGDRPAVIGADDRVVVPIDAPASVGITADDELDVSVGEVGEVGEVGDPITGTVQDGGGAVTLDRSDLVDAAGGADAISIDVVHDGVPVTGGETSVGPELRQVDGLVFWHPSVDAGSEYRVAAEADTGRYVDVVVAEESGQLELPPGLADDGSVDVTVSETGSDAVVNGTNLELEPFSLTAKPADGGETLDFDQQIHDLSVMGILPDGNRSSYRSVDGSIDDGTLELNDTTVSHNDTLVLSTGAGVANVAVNEASSSPEPDRGLLAAILAAPGNLMGVIGEQLPNNVLAGIEAIMLPLLPVLTGVALGYALGRFIRISRQWMVYAIFVLGYIQGIAVVVLMFTIGDHQYIPNSIQPQHILGAVGIIFSGLATVVSYTVFHRPETSRKERAAVGSTGTGSRDSTTVSEFTATVTVTDGNQRLGGETTLEVTPKNGRYSRRTEQVSDGRTQLRLSGGTRWEIHAKRGPHSSAPRTVSKTSPNATLTVAVPELSATVRNRENGEPIPDATVELEAGGRTERERTDDRGRVTFDPPDTASKGTLTFDHETFEPTSRAVSLAAGESVTADLRPLTGGVEIVTSVDGVPTGPMPVRLAPQKSPLTQVAGTIDDRTDRDGTARRSGLIVGRYRVTVDVPGASADQFDAGTATATVREGRTVTVEIDSRFDWSLSPAQQRRVDVLRKDVASFTEVAGRDTTIPGYYGSVAEAMLDAVESLPRSGHLFAADDETVGPDELADAMLVSIERSIDAISEAMTTKRNIDLFAACEDMPRQTVTWDGEYDLEGLVEQLGTSRMDQRSRVKDRYERVSERIDQRRADVSEITPAQEMLKQSWRLVDEDDSDSRLETVATAHASLLLLGAVEELFEYAPLRERLSRTVF